MDSREARRDPSLQIGDSQVDRALNQIIRNGAVVHLRPQVCDLLVLFAQHPNEVLSKHQIFEAVWPGQFVSESALKSTIAEVRQALGDTGRQSRVIENISKRGYRLIAPVSRLPPSTMALTLTPTAGPSAAASTVRRAVVRRSLVPIGVVLAVLAAAAAAFFAWRARRAATIPAEGVAILVADFVNRTAIPFSMRRSPRPRELDSSSRPPFASYPTSASVKR